MINSSADQSLFESYVSEKFQCAHIAPIFNLIQTGSIQGCFNPIYLQPTFQAGLALQLFSVLLFGKIRLPDRVWYPANIKVIYYSGDFAGFIFMRSIDQSNFRQEIYMCAIDSNYQGKRLGKRLVHAAITDTQSNVSIEAECLPAAFVMKHILLSMGFSPVKSQNTPHIEKFVFHNVLG